MVIAPPALLDLLSADAWASGARLAARLGVSRAAVWKQVEALRAAGVAVEARAGRGYRLAQPLELLDAGAIRQALAPAIRKKIGALEVHWRLDSTSSELLRRAAELPDRAFVFAEAQTAGRGRRGRAWLSPPAMNLSFSCLKRFDSGFTALSGLSLAAGVAAARALEDCGVRGVQLKWPNDLVRGNAKLAGILVELGGEFLGPCHAVIGVGVNVRMSDDARAQIGQSVTDLAQLCGVPPPRNALAAALVRRLCEALDIFADAGFAAFAGDYAQRDALRDRALRIDDPRGAFEGIGAGVDARGALRVRSKAGEQMLDSAEITVRAA